MRISIILIMRTPEYSLAIVSKLAFYSNRQIICVHNCEEQIYETMVNLLKDLKT